MRVVYWKFSSFFDLFPSFFLSIRSISKSNARKFNGSLTQHYESLPLTTTEVLLESTPSSTPTKTRGEEIERNEGTKTRDSQSSHKSPNHNRVTDMERKNDPDLTEELLQQTVTTPKWRTIDIEIEKEKENEKDKEKDEG